MSKLPASALRSLLAGLVVLGVACGSGKAPAATPASTPDEVQSIDVALTPAGCDPLSLTLKAGPVTFNLSNKGTSVVSEFEVEDGNGVLLGEAESIVPGIDHSFSLTLPEGIFTTYCPGGTQGDYGTLTVLPGAQDDSDRSPEYRQAVQSYRSFLLTQTALLVSATEPLVDAVLDGDIERAKQLYPVARAPYERIEPVAESFRSLDPAIDSREGDVAADQTWTGFHRLEKALWQDKSLNGMAPIADQLLKDVKSLQVLVGNMSLQPAQIANGAVELLNEVTKTKITGEEERYSHIDLVDFAANVDGSLAAFEAVKPLLAAKDANLAEQISQRYTTLSSALAAYKSGDAFVSYTQLSKNDTKKLSAAIDALAEPLSKVAKRILT